MGKSTLLKIVAGQYQPDQGGIVLGGRERRFLSPHEARAASIAMVYQELTLLPDMTVLDNLFLGAEPVGAARLLDRKAMRSVFTEKAARFGFRLDPDVPVGSLPLAEQQLVEVFKALIGDPDIVIFDEATSALDNAEVETLFSVIQALRREGRTIIFISHRMEEIFRIGDKVTVLKDGKKIVTRNISEITQDQLIEYMVGRPLHDIFPAKSRNIGEGVFEVRSLGTWTQSLSSVSLTAHWGEIVGIAALQGQGQAELLACLAGVQRYDSGEIRLDGKTLPQAGPRQAIRRGVILVPEDRKTQALFLGHSVHVNLSLSSQYRRQRWGFLSQRLDTAFVRGMIRDLAIRCGSRRNDVQNLSGGNQQKVVLGRVLGVKPRVILFNEPTRGVDIGTKQEFYRRMRALANQGIAVILYSSDLIEVIGISDTVYTLFEGKVTGVLKGRDINEVRIMRGLMGVEETVS